MLYWVRGVSFFHEMALNVNTLAQALNSLEDDNPLMISGLLLRSALNRKSALDIAIDNESPKSVEAGQTVVTLSKDGFKVRNGGMSIFS